MHEAPRTAQSKSNILFQPALEKVHSVHMALRNKKSFNVDRPFETAVSRLRYKPCVDKGLY